MITVKFGVICLRYSVYMMGWLYIASSTTVTVRAYLDGANVDSYAIDNIHVEAVFDALNALALLALRQIQSHLEFP